MTVWSKAYTSKPEGPGSSLEKTDFLINNGQASYALVSLITKQYKLVRTSYIASWLGVIETLRELMPCSLTHAVEQLVADKGCRPICNPEKRLKYLLFIITACLIFRIKK